MHDSSAALILAGSGSTHFLGRAGMQEMFYRGFENAVDVFRPITKGAWLVVRPDQVVDVLNTALKAATSGRPGPVFVQIPYDVQLAEVEGEIEAVDRRRATAERLNVPVVTTLPAKGILPEDHPLSLGPVGRSGTNAAARATREADLVIAVGARFSDNHTGNWRKGMIYDVPQTKIAGPSRRLAQHGPGLPRRVARRDRGGDPSPRLADSSGPDVLRGR
jgi:acetolactate synthase-1/2/3 large subunit